MSGLAGVLVAKVVAALTGGQARARKRVKIGPHFVNLSWTRRKGDEDRGFWRSLIPRVTSRGHQAGPVTRNTTHGTTTWDTPGTGSVRWGGRGRRR